MGAPLTASSGLPAISDQAIAAKLVVDLAPARCGSDKARPPVTMPEPQTPRVALWGTVLNRRG